MLKRSIAITHKFGNEGKNGVEGRETQSNPLKKQKKPRSTYVFYPVLYGAHQPLEMLA